MPGPRHRHFASLDWAVTRLASTGCTVMPSR
ncbi:hypothetical protein X801_04957 [Opisthorchis viverrini]|uniref:Uncharacterized protein n=1 Tax=Opisthorchis viverrini TaxID=6198 RepID=A0A1S8WXE1_OPIVI|nr:hypothetical protein X801_04957 [Opisthorchis viverrini]